jgi:hypothetical protein
MLKTHEEYYLRMVEAVRRAWTAKNKERREHFLAVAKVWRLYSQIAEINLPDARAPIVTLH